MEDNLDLCNEVLKTLRKIIRAIDLNSKKNVREYNLTGPQLLVLKDLFDNGASPVGSLAKRVLLSHATVTEIIDRLEKKAYVRRVKSKEDKRKIFVFLEEKARDVLKKNPSLIQEKFVREFSLLPDWEKSMILSNFQKVAFLMDAENIDASPILINSSVVQA